MCQAVRTAVADFKSGAVTMTGRGYSADGETVVFWTSDASSVNPNKREVFFMFSGRYSGTPSELLEGFGEFTFDEALRNAIGTFFTTNVSGGGNVRKNFTLERMSTKESKLLAQGSKAELKALILRRLHTAPTKGAVTGLAH